jgi:hypothetical protein
MLALALVFALPADLGHVRWAARLSAEGSPPPPRDPASATGYALGQRHFLGTHQRGETYRWIAATQDLLAEGPFASSHYEADNAPRGRPQLLPRIYAVWLAGLAWVGHILTGEPLPLAVEQAALWEPVMSHVLALLAVATCMGIRFGPAGAGLAGLFFVVYPPLSGQFLPGALTTDTWALLLAAYAIARPVPVAGRQPQEATLDGRAALAAGLALWLDPAFGFAAVVIGALTGAVALCADGPRQRFLSWSLLGAGVILAAWIIDQAPWDPKAGELRYVHPLYAMAWLGLGLALDGWQRWRTGAARRTIVMLELAAALLLTGSLGFVQGRNGYWGWLYPGGTTRRLTSLDETRLFPSAVHWLSQVSIAEALLVTLSLLVTIVALVLARPWRPPVKSPRPADSRWLVVVVVLATVTLLALFKVRWFVLATLVTLPVLGHLARNSTATLRRGLVVVSGVVLAGLVLGRAALPESIRRPTEQTPLRPVDLQALLHRHFSHWFAAHHPGRAVSALAPPELSDAIVFHGGGRVLMSTAWESYPGLVAASRVLSAPEATEAEAVLEGLGLTHVILPSWDPALPLLVQQPLEEGRDTLYARLQRWVLPRYLRPVPYHLPPVPGFLDQKLPVFQMTPPQDEALALARLAEYFVEMNRPEPATAAAEVLARSFPDDPNAAIARATVYAQAGQATALRRELERLEADIAAGRVPFLWDRRVQRAIVLALGQRPEVARAEVAACIATISAEALFELTPLQAHRLRTLAKGFEVPIPDPRLTELLRALGAEYAASSDRPATQ